jgi:hypothetical protein
MKFVGNPIPTSLNEGAPRIGNARTNVQPKQYITDFSDWSRWRYYPWHTADIDPNITKIDIDIDFISVLCYKIP